MAVAKPQELLALYEPANDIYRLVRNCFQVPDQHRLDLGSIDAIGEDITTTAALTLHCVRRVRQHGTPGRRVAVHRVITTASELHSLLTTLAAECDEFSTQSRLLQFREQVGMAAGAVIQVVQQRRRDDAGDDEDDGHLE